MILIKFLAALVCLYAVCFYIGAMFAGIWEKRL
jgi:hypothetical protein